MAAVIGIRNLPQMAEYGWASITFYLTAALFFFFPVSLVCAELASGWPKRGGVYIWVREAFGPRIGFLAIWMQWIACIPWYPAVLSFLAVTIAYTIDPALADNKIYLLVVILAFIWISTAANFLDMKISGWISSGGVLLGSILPALLIIGLGFAWPFLGNETEISLLPSQLMPDIDIGNVVFFAGVVLALSGMELSASSVTDVINPRRNYPRAIFISGAVILFISCLGSLSIAFIIPKEDLSLVAGIMPAVEVFFEQFGQSWAVPYIALLIVIGTIALVNTWFLAPLKGLLETARYGSLPKFCLGSNRYGAPSTMLIVQAVLTSVFSIIFLYVDDIGTSFWILSVLSIQLYIIMYFLIFLSVLKLRYTQPDIPRLYKIPGGKVGLWSLVLMGLSGSLYAFVVGFFPPAELNIGNPFAYGLFLIGGMIILGSPPLIIYWYLHRNSLSE